jgi:hypothetical protein
MSSTAALATASLPKAGSGERALRFSATAWWLVTIIGQWVFLYYVAGFYDRATLTGHLQDWNRNHELFKGYAPGDTAWNAYFAAHMLLAAVIAFGGSLQMIAQLRKRAIGFHRWNGRAFMLAAVGGAASGLWMTLVRHTGVSGNGHLGALAISLNAVLIIAFAVVAWHRAYSGKIAAHRQWALRLFMVANGVWFLRLGIFGCYLLTGGAGMTDQLDGPLNFVLDFASYLLPLACLQLYFHARQGGTARSKVAAAAVILLCTGFMCIGIFGLTMFQLPLMPKL